MKTDCFREYKEIDLVGRANIEQNRILAGGRSCQRAAIYSPNGCFLWIFDERGKFRERVDESVGGFADNGGLGLRAIGNSLDHNFCHSCLLRLRPAARSAKIPTGEYFRASAGEFANQIQA